MLKIFIIDDDINILIGLQAKFNLAGYQASILNEQSIEEIIYRIKINRPDYLIVEPNLNIINGFELMSKTKSNSETAHIPIIAFSNLDNLAKEKSIKFGADYFFNKAELLIDEFVLKFNKILINQKKLQPLYEN